jgi:hypothetical protein
MRPFHPARIIYHKAIVILCVVQYVQVRMACRGCFLTTIGVSLWCSIVSGGCWLPKILQLYLYAIPFKWNVASFKETRRAQWNHITVSLLQRLLTTSLTTVTVRWFASTTVRTHADVNVCIQCHKLCSGEDAPACSSTCAVYLETVLQCASYLCWISSGVFYLRQFHFLSDVYSTS